MSPTDAKCYSICTFGDHPTYWCAKTEKKTKNHEKNTKFGFPQNIFQVLPANPPHVAPPKSHLFRSVKDRCHSGVYAMFFFFAKKIWNLISDLCVFGASPRPPLGQGTSWDTPDAAALCRGHTSTPKLRPACMTDHWSFLASGPLEPPDIRKCTRF